MNVAQIKIVRFGGRDVIATSGLTLTVDGTYNGTNNDATFTFGGKAYTSAEILKDQSIVSNYFGSSFNKDTTTFWKNESDRIGGNTIFGLAYKDTNTTDGDYISETRTSNDYNNTYVFKNGNFYISQ